MSVEWHIFPKLDRPSSQSLFSTKVEAFEIITEMLWQLGIISLGRLTAGAMKKKKVNK